MMHSFDIDIAKEYGLNEAILLNNLWFWVEHNRANNINYYDGNYWTYNSTRAFNELFPYLSQRQIQNALKKLRDKGILIVGNYNKSSYDRTLWYAFSELGKCIMQKCKMDITNSNSQECENVKPIPNNKQSNNKTKNNKTNIYHNQSIYLDSDIEEQIGYNTFNDDRIDEIVLLIKEVLNSTKETIRVNGENKSAHEVKNRFLKLNKLHIDYVLHCLDSNSTEIKNIKAYIVSCLYNSISTINSYYDAKVRHDLGY